MRSRKSIFNFSVSLWFKNYWPLAALLALTLIFFYKLAFTNLILARGDTFAYFYPYWSARNAALLQGQLPLWTPDLFMGVPLLANSQLGTFYPLNWLFTSFSSPNGIRLSILLHVYWGLVGAYLLARNTGSSGAAPQQNFTWASALPALAAAAIFGLGGYTGAHVEQINQLQGISWMPWLFLAYNRALEKPLRDTLLLALGLALQFLSGHTQTVFITALGLGIYGVILGMVGAHLRNVFRSILILAMAAFIMLLLVTPQILPLLELAGVSNRSSGLNQNQATAFSFNPLVMGRGLLPSYDGLLFAEYVAYGGVIGLGLAVIGALISRRSPLSGNRFLWLVVALAGFILALGEFNPLYWALATLPGFNLFRVPARWLALFSLGMAMLAGLGLQSVIEEPRRNRRVYAAILALIGLFMVSSTLITRAPEDVIGPAAPTAITWFGWSVALCMLMAMLVIREKANQWAQRAVPLLGIGLVIELFFAAGVLPYNHLVTPDTYYAERFTTSQLRAYAIDQMPPGRVLSISDLLFDPGDRAALEARYRQYGLSDLAIRLALVDTKMKETLAANLPLLWNIPTIDGFDGGVLPTKYFTAFTSLLLPPGELRTLDGRLREIMAREDCRGACIPDQRWLNLTNTRYLITDKIYDVWHEGVAYDTQFEINLTPGKSVAIQDVPEFEANAVYVLCYNAESCLPHVTLTHADLSTEELDSTPASGPPGYAFARLEMSEARAPLFIQLENDSHLRVNALTLVDTRTGDFAQVTLGPWRKQLSSDIKLYENTIVLPRAFIVHDIQVVPDSDLGTEDALNLMRNANFDPAQTAILSENSSVGARRALPVPEAADSSAATIISYTPERIEIAVKAAAEGYLMLTDAFYPGWLATVNGLSADILRADVMFRAVSVPAGESLVAFVYQPYWMSGALIAGALAWMAALAAVALLWWRRA